MVSRGEECTFGELPPNVFKQGSFGISTPHTAPPAPSTLVQALPPSPSPSRSPGPPTGLNPTFQPWPSPSGAVSSSVSLLTPRSLQERRADLALKVDGVLRETNDAQSRLAAQDTRLGVIQQGLKIDSATTPRSQRMDQLRQHITDLRTIVMEDGSRVPGALQHVQRMLRLLAGQANAVQGDDGGREVTSAIDVLSGEVSQLIELTERGDRTAGEVMTIRRTLEDLQQDVSTASRSSSPVVTSGRSPLNGAQTIVMASSSPQTLSRPGELADLRAKVSALSAECEYAVGEAARARAEVSEIHSKLGYLQRSLEANLATSMNTKSADYSDELAACSSQRSPNGEVLDAAVCNGIREQMRIFAAGISNLDVRLKEAEDRLQSMATRPETLLVSKELVQNLRQEVLNDVEDLRNKVQDSKISPLSSIGQAEAGQLVSIGLTQLREVGSLAGVLNLPSIIAGSQGASAPAVLATQVQDLGSEVARLAAMVTRSPQAQAIDDSTDSKKNIALLFDDVKKMKEYFPSIVSHLAKTENHDMIKIEERFQGLRKELTGAIAELRVKSPPVVSASTQESSSGIYPKSDFAALREGLNNLKLKHSLPQEISTRAGANA